MKKETITKLKELQKIIADEAQLRSIFQQLLAEEKE